jgi:hypothetical protein
VGQGHRQDINRSVEFACARSADVPIFVRLLLDCIVRFPSDPVGTDVMLDSHRDLISAAAAKAYVRGSSGSYNLLAGDF